MGTYWSFLFPEACGDLIAAVFDFAHGMCALKLTEQQLALFSALVLINAGKSKKFLKSKMSFSIDMLKFRSLFFPRSFKPFLDHKDQLQTHHTALSTPDKAEKQVCIWKMQT